MLLMAMFLAGPPAATSALADAASDRKACFAVGYGGQKRVDACTGFINSGRLSKSELSAALQSRAEGYRIIEQYERALADFDRALALDPRLARGYANRAEVYRVLGQFEKVIADTTEAIRLDPTPNAFYAIRGFAYERQGDVARARADYNKALALPIKDADGGWAQDVARGRLKELDNK